MAGWMDVPNSTNVAAVSYDANKAELYVRFKDGSTYTYMSVPDGIDRQLLESDSPGKFVRNDLAVYQYRRG